MGRRARSAWLVGDLTWYSGAHEARRDEAEVATGDALLQSPDPSSRPGALHADAGRRQAARDRPVRCCRSDAMSRCDKRSSRKSSARSRRRPTKPRSKRCASQRSARAARCRRCCKTLGGMTPDERKAQGPLINGLKDRVTAAIAARREALKDAALDARLNTETVDVTLPVRESPAEAGPHSSDQPGDRRTHRDLRRHGLCGRRRAGHRDRRSQLHQAEFPRRPSGAGHARHVLFQSEAGRLAHAAAHAHLAGADPHDARPEAADPRHHSGPHLSRRLGPDAHADVPSGRGAGDRQGLAPRPHEVDPARSSARPSSRSTT